MRGIGFRWSLTAAGLIAIIMAIRLWGEDSRRPGILLLVGTVALLLSLFRFRQSATGTNS